MIDVGRDVADIIHERDFGRAVEIEDRCGVGIFVRPYEESLGVGGYAPRLYVLAEAYPDLSRGQSVRVDGEPQSFRIAGPPQPASRGHVVLVLEEVS